MLSKLSAFAHGRLSDGQFSSARDAYFRYRKKMYPLMRSLYGTFDAKDLREHLETRLDPDLEILMVHVSVNHLAPMYEGNALSLVRMLMEYCGEARTLVMPAFYFGDPERGGVLGTFRSDPRFDLRRTPSQMGLATELFRRSPDVLQSRHPVYRVSAKGPLADELTRDHHRAAEPSGKHSPFDVMARHNTQIIGIGKTIEILTQVHHAEALMGDEFPVPLSRGDSVPVVVVDGDEEFELNLPQRDFTWKRNMSKLRAIMNREKLREWRFHHVPLFAVKAADVTDCLVRAAREGITLYEPD